MRTNLVCVPFVFFSCLCLASPAQDAPEDYSVLNGSWYLDVGWEAPQQDPRLTLSMAVDGNKVYGDGDLQVPGCGLSFSVIGQIASDGTFVLNLQKPVGDRADDNTFPSLSISGKVPAQGSTEWAGSFNTSSMGNGECPRPSGEFVASQLPQLEGNYSGTIPSFVGSAPGTPLSISVNMTQGISTSTDEGESSSPEVSPAARVSHYVPLRGTIAVSALTDLPSEDITAKAVADRNSRMQGDEFILFFRFADGSSMMLTGSKTDSSGQAVLASFSFFGKNQELIVSGMGNLTRR
jgi:hypothetical protein